MTRKITREEFEEMITPDVVRLEQLMIETLAKGGITADQVEFVEMIGDTTRAPIILECTKKVF